MRQEINASANKEMVIISFRKYGFSVPIDGTENDKIHIKGLDDQKVEGSE